MSQRFFSETPVADARVTLTGPEAHHLTHVMRAAVGDEVILFDGSGVEATATVATINRATVDLDVVTRAVVDRELPCHVHVAAALPKGDRQRWMIEKLVELGVTEFVPLLTQRSVVKPDGKSLTKLRRAVIEASKQCRRNVLMAIADPCKFVDYVAAAPTDAWRVIAHPGAAACAEPTSEQAVWIAVGPEGGFTDDEIAGATDRGWQSRDLGARILRTETAAVALASSVALNRPN